MSVAGGADRVIRMTPEELESLVARAVNEAVSVAVAQAVEAKTDQLRAEARSEVEVREEHVKIEQMSKAANEPLVMHYDSGRGYEYAVIHLDRVDFNPLSRRNPEELDPDNAALRELIEEIAHRGGLNRPLLVYRQKDKEGRYMLVKGSRRLAALRAMGEETSYAYILPAKPPIDMEERWVNGY